MHLLRIPFALGCASLILSVPSFLNQSPLFYHDSGFYLALGKIRPSPDILFWRPLTYSLFLRACFSFGSIFAVPIATNLIVAGVLFASAKNLNPQITCRGFLIICGLLYITSLPYYSNIILPDVFTGLLALSISLLNPRFCSKLGAFLLLLVTSITHYVNLVVGVGVLFFFWPFRRKKKSLVRLLALLAPVGLLTILHFGMTRHAFVVNTFNIVLYSKFAALGIADDYLNQYCAEQTYALCSHRDTSFHIWDWGPNSRIYKSGGYSKLGPELAQINWNIVLSPLLWEALKRSTHGIIKQLLWFAEPPEPNTQDPRLAEELYTHSEILGYDYIRQRLRSEHVSQLTKIVTALTVASTLVGFLLVVILLAFGLITPPVFHAFRVTFFVYFISAIICGLFTEPMARYSGRIIWVFSFLLIVQASILLPRFRKGVRNCERLA